LQAALAEELEQVNLSSEDYILRTVKTLSVINEILKEFMYDDSIKDKKQLSTLTGFIGRSIERLKGEHKKRFGGPMASFFRIIFPED
jgi:hypothetical protein